MDIDDEEMEPRPQPPRAPMRWYVAGAVAAIALLLVGAAAGVVWSGRQGAARSRVNRADAAALTVSQDGARMPGMPGMPMNGKPAAPAQAGDDAVEVTLAPEAVERAGIKIAEARTAASTSALIVPGTVVSNAYLDTKVNALVGGIVRQVSAELGTAVRHGQTLAVVFSSELADAQMKYLSMRAMLEADHRKLQRTEKLVTIGAASHQELEEVTAVHAGHETEVAAARQRLLLLGLSPDRAAKLESAAQVVSEVTVPSPADGVVVARAVNPGQVINAGQELFAVTDLGAVWVIGDLYENGFSRVRVGSWATVTVPATPDRKLQGRVAYIDPRVDPATRTAKVRIEVPNREGDLRLGMFVTINLQTTSGGHATLVPRTAVQSIGERAVVYVPAEGEDGKFVERSVKLGPAAGDLVQVLEGLKPGEKVVTEGSFFLRAEAGRTRSGGS